MADIGKNIRQQRIQKNMTQDDLAARIHTTRQTVSNYETGRSRPDVDTLPLLAEALECNVEQLLSGEATPRMGPQERKRLLRSAGITAALLVLYWLLRAIFDPILRERYTIPQLANFAIHLCRFLWPVALGWTVMQAGLALRLLRPRSSRWVHSFLIAFIVFYIGSFFIPLAPFTYLWRTFMVYHLFPADFWGGLVLMIMGAAIRFTKEV